MATLTIERPEIIDTATEAQQNDHRFFDPRSPAQPEEIFGIETEAILALGRAVTALSVLPPKVNLGLYTLPNAVRLVPLVEEMRAGTSLTPEDVRPYRKPIKRLSMEVGFADKAAATAGALALGIPLRRALNRKIEREFPARAAEAIDKARQAVASVENDVEHVASFKNPKEQFVTELHDLAQTVSSAITEQRDIRIRTGAHVETEPETPSGIAGFLTRAARKVRSFFGMFKPNRPAVNTEITAYDAGAGIEQAIGSLVENPIALEGRLPLLSKLLLSRLPATMPITKDKLALGAPEILNFLFSTSPADETGSSLIDSVKRNPHELRFVTGFKKRYGRYSLDGIQRASVTLMPAIRDVLPNDGAKVRNIFAQAQDLLTPNPLAPESLASTSDDAKTKSPLKLLRKLFNKKDSTRLSNYQ
jgi:hypothetical protein